MLDRQMHPRMFVLCENTGKLPAKTIGDGGGDLDRSHAHDRTAVEPSGQITAQIARAHSQGKSQTPTFPRQTRCIARHRAALLQNKPDGSIFVRNSSGSPRSMGADRAGGGDSFLCCHHSPGDEKKEGPARTPALVQQPQSAARDRKTDAESAGGIVRNGSANQRAAGQRDPRNLKC